LTLREDQKGFVHASRALARTLLANHLFQHAKTIGLAIHSFDSLDDPEWDAYRLRSCVGPSLCCSREGYR
jgi:hypothetical protein